MARRVQLQPYAPFTQGSGAGISQLDIRAVIASICLTTHPLRDHSVGYCLGRKNRLTGGFFISGTRKVL